MPMDIIPRDLYPIVPQAAGVPALLRSAASIADAATFGLLGISDKLNGLIGDATPKWGVYDAKGNPVALADSVIAVDWRTGAKVADYPMENGAFQSYNKVQLPYMARVTLSCAGNASSLLSFQGGQIVSGQSGLDARTAFIVALEAAQKSLDLFGIYTPERIYQNANIEGMDYRRTADGGSGMLVVELYIREIRNTATAKYSPKSDSAAKPENSGSAQARDTKPAERTLDIGTDGNWVDWQGGINRAKAK